MVRRIYFPVVCCCALETQMGPGLEERGPLPDGQVRPGYVHCCDYRPLFPPGNFPLDRMVMSQLCAPLDLSELDMLGW